MEDVDEIWEKSLSIRKILRKFYRKRLIRVSNLASFEGLDKMSKFIEASLEAFTELILDCVESNKQDQNFVVRPSDR